MLFNPKSLDDLMTTSLARLRETPITESGPGGIARLFLAIINEQLAEVHEALNASILSLMVSRATGESLDAIGLMVDCTRNDNENDDNYRYRITKQVHAAATANPTAIRLAALSVEGVKDIVVKRFVRGTGSFGVYIITDAPVPSEETLEAVREAVSVVAAEGIRVEVFRPILLPVELMIKVFIDKRANDSERRAILTNSTRELRNYINSRSVGVSIDTTEVKNLLHEIHKYVLGYEVLVFSVQDSPRFWTHQHANWNERFIEASKPNAILLV